MGSRNLATVPALEELWRFSLVFISNQGPFIYLFSMFVTIIHMLTHVLCFGNRASTIGDVLKLGAKKMMVWVAADEWNGGNTVRLMRLATVDAPFLIFTSVAWFRLLCSTVVVGSVPHFLGSICFRLSYSSFLLLRCLYLTLICNQVCVMSSNL